MINKVGEQNSTWNKVPLKFEAGTPNIGEVISLGASIDFIDSISCLFFLLFAAAEREIVSRRKKNCFTIIV